MSSKSDSKTYFLLISTTVIWGIQPMCIKWLLGGWTPVTITVMRYVFIGIILLAIAGMKKERILPQGKEWLYLFGMGLTGIGINNVLQFTGLQYSTVTDCTLIAASSPAITAFLSAIFIREKLSRRVWLGIAISFAGALLVVSKGSWDVIRSLNFNIGDLFFLTCQVAWTIYSLFALKVMRKMTAAAATGWAGLIGAGITLCFGLSTGMFEIAPLDTLMLGSFVFAVAFGGVMAMLFWNIGVRNIGPSRTAIFQNISPIVGMVGGSIFFSEVIGLPQILGAAGIFLGVYITTHSS